MTFWELFIRLLPWRPAPALTALYWHLTRRRVRARIRLLTALAPLPLAHEIWVARVERADDRETEIRRAMQNWRIVPHFSFFLHGKSDEISRKLTIQSIERQGYSSWDIAQSLSLSEALRSATGNYVLLIRAGDFLASTALYELGEAIEAHPDAALFYGDHDEMGVEGQRARPWFKPQWNEELFLAQDYLLGAVALEAEFARAIASDAMDIHDLLLTATAANEGAIMHVPHILSHTTLRTEEPEARLRALGRHLHHRGAEAVPGPFETAKVNWPLPAQPPLVSIIIPTKDKLELLEPCVDGILNRTNYSPVEILIVDNGSVEPRTTDYLDRIGQDGRVRVLNHPAPYNFSEINNVAVQAAKGAYLCLLNNDTEVLNPDWLAEMMRYAVREEVGAVGAKLLYEDGSIQHAGVAIGIGGAAGHSHRFLRNDDAGYFAMAHVAHFVSAVTAACLVVEKRKYLAVGGLDERHLAVAFNDVDFCLKLRAAGWRNVYTPHAVLVHHESKSRGSDTSPRNIKRYEMELAVLQERWGTKTYVDPVHNPNLDRHSETFVADLAGG